MHANIRWPGKFSSGSHRRLFHWRRKSGHSQLRVWLALYTDPASMLENQFDWTGQLVIG